MARRAAVGLLAAAVVGSGTAFGQPDLPPPPPPPIGQATDVPVLPPPPAPPGGEATAPPIRRRTAPASPTTVAHVRKRIESRPELPAPETAPPPTIAFTWNPADIGWGRLSANVEVRLARHHSLTATPDALVFHANRGGATALISEGFGFASPTSFGLGAELGYHYWLEGLGTLSGPFFGPSLVFGATSRANVGDASRTQGYWGVALDLGTEQVLFGGFIAGAGVGLEVLHMADATAVVPRLLAQLGWAF